MSHQNHPKFIVSKLSNQKMRVKLQEIYFRNYLQYMLVNKIQRRTFVVCMNIITINNIKTVILQDMFVNNAKINTSRFFLLCYIMRNFQKKLNIIWQTRFLNKPLFCLNPSLFSKNFQPPPFPSILQKLKPRLPHYDKGLVQTMLTFSFFDRFYSPSKLVDCSSNPW